ncbi:LGT_TIGR03299, phage/plasmid-like protein TIGR03299 [uncultured Caudovirales phage]|uniref:LGT_TIGR03299, phage/plasmid-like protein TIGR03299 n=1 Tax=uncultured Caudovirales phage TaxID=2100421 RepID=A0A6J5M5I9_9CAUD|nr:LGT_TIGR03299, phage/plasmid-like protein TIGR03299 [uncultured Caudovirales phage]
MAHNIEMIDGKAQMAYAGDTPWHGLGTRVPDDLTPEQMLEAAGLDWDVQKIEAFAKVGGKNVSVNRSALVRSSDNKILDVVSNDWNPVQNQEAFEFFNDFISEGEMEMHTAGSLQDGKIVWALAKVKDSFELFGGDQVDSYLHFTNFHKYGCSTDVRFTPIRVVCNNTLTLSLNTKVERMVKISHRREFDGDNVKLMLGVAAEKLAKYKQMAQFLGSKRYNNENIVEYFKRVFPIAGNGGGVKKELSKNADLALSILDTQPGANFAEGTWWQAFNSVTYVTDHLAGRTADTRLTSAWYGAHKGLKTTALETAIEMAEAA